MAYEDDPKIQPPIEHIEQLAAVGQSAQDKRKPPQRRSNRRHLTDVEQTLEEEQQLRHVQDDGHINYQA
jgi:hypothetical protein